MSCWNRNSRPADTCSSFCFSRKLSETRTRTGHSQRAGLGHNKNMVQFLDYPKSGTGFKTRTGSKTRSGFKTRTGMQGSRGQSSC